MLEVEKVEAILIAEYVTVECLASLDYSCQRSTVVEWLGIRTSVTI